MGGDRHCLTVAYGKPEKKKNLSGKGSKAVILQEAQAENDLIAAEPKEQRIQRKRYLANQKDWASVMMRWKGYQQGAKADLQEESALHVDKTVVRRRALLRN